MDRFRAIAKSSDDVMHPYLLQLSGERHTDTFCPVVAY
jgi:hypothetical protein